jgi:hypothetical protein
MRDMVSAEAIGVEKSMDANPDASQEYDDRVEKE